MDFENRGHESQERDTSVVDQPVTGIRAKTQRNLEKWLGWMVSPSVSSAIKKPSIILAYQETKEQLMDAIVQYVLEVIRYQLDESMLDLYREQDGKIFLGTVLEGNDDAIGNVWSQIQADLQIEIVYSPGIGTDLEDFIQVVYRNVVKNKNHQYDYLVPKNKRQSFSEEGYPEIRL